MRRFLSLLAVLSLMSAAPIAAQRNGSSPKNGVGNGSATDLPPAVCPPDHRDGPLQADGRSYYGITARRIVEGFLAPPNDLPDRIETGTQHLDSSSLRILADSTDYDACIGLTMAMTNGARSAPAPQPWVYFTAGGFYFVGEWKPAQALSNYSTSYGHVQVYDRTYELLGAYAF
jgi:hypothetical protein